MRIGIHNTNDSTGAWTLRADLEEGERMWGTEGQELTHLFPIIGISSIREVLLKTIAYDPGEGFVYDVE